ncbi:EamA family transporter [Candidatus Uhrbacteria bacterium]|nr:EamA family transporter [Candidatus Uhrbacteria bacterium]
MEVLSRKGIIAACMISVTAAIALPFVNVLEVMKVEELMIVRGGVTSIMVALLLSSHVSRPSWRILQFSTLFSLATLCLFYAIRAWGPGPSLVVITLTPIVNIVAKLLRGKNVERRVYFAMTGLLVGVMIALNPWQASFDLEGFALSMLAMLLAGFGMEVMAGKKGIDAYNKTFWLALVTTLIGCLASVSTGQIPFVTVVWTFWHALALVGFGVVGGFCYYLANIIAVEELETEVATTIAMAETPAVIVSSWLMLGDTLTYTQWSGVLIALLATYSLVHSQKKNTP